MKRPEVHRAVRVAALAGLLIHTLAVLYVWRSWGPFGAANLMLWMSFPASLAYLGASGGTLLALSLLCGGIEWALLAGLIAYGIGRSLDRPDSP